MEVDDDRMNYYTEFEMVKRLTDVVRKAGSQKEAARRLGISPQYLHDILGRGRPIGPKVLKALGYRRVVVYVRGAQ